MEESILKSIEEYKKRHPEVEEIMRQFHMSQEAYNRALSSIGTKVRRTGNTYTLTTGGKYNLNISRPTN